MMTVESLVRASGDRPGLCRGDVKILFGDFFFVSLKGKAFCFLKVNVTTSPSAFFMLKSVCFTALSGLGYIISKPKKLHAELPHTIW